MTMAEAGCQHLSEAGTVERLKIIFARFGIPEVLMTDNGPQLTSSEFAAFTQEYDF